MPKFSGLTTKQRYDLHQYEQAVFDHWTSQEYADMKTAYLGTAERYYIRQDDLPDRTLSAALRKTKRVISKKAAPYGGPLAAWKLLHRRTEDLT